MLLNIYDDNDSDIKKPCENICVNKKESLKYALNQRIIWKMSDKYDELKKYVNINEKENEKEKQRKMIKMITMMIKMHQMKKIWTIKNKFTYSWI